MSNEERLSHSGVTTTGQKRKTKPLCLNFPTLAFGHLRAEEEDYIFRSVEKKKKMPTDSVSFAQPVLAD